MPRPVKTPDEAPSAVNGADCDRRHRCAHLWPALAWVTFMAGSASAQEAPSAGELLRDIEHLQVVGSVLYVAAHPDDENTRLISWLVGHRGLRTGYLSLTRGGGGQNLIGSEQSELLGVVRTGELLAARGVDGGEQWFTRARDFGYSKSPEESLDFWGHDEVLDDVLRVYETFRPDVVITRFPTDGRSHGHHIASARLAGEAFEKARRELPSRPSAAQPVQLAHRRGHRHVRLAEGGRRHVRPADRSVLRRDFRHQPDDAQVPGLRLLAPGRRADRVLRGARRHPPSIRQTTCSPGST